MIKFVSFVMIRIDIGFFFSMCRSFFIWDNRYREIRVCACLICSLFISG